MAHVYQGISSFSIASIVELVIFLWILSSFSIAFIVELVIFLCSYLICLPAWGELSY